MGKAKAKGKTASKKPVAKAKKPPVAKAAPSLDRKVQRMARRAHNLQLQQQENSKATATRSAKGSGGEAPERER